MIRFSLVIPIYNRPNEAEELLESLTLQTFTNFEVLIVEDGSSIDCKNVVDKYSNKLNIKYFFKQNSGPGTTRNYGAERSEGEIIIYFDSDCIIPPQYLEVVNSRLSTNYTDAFGGPDRAHESFTPLQKAINYSMTSFLTTGGIRGGKHKLDKFFPRSFNMGYSRKVFEVTNGFSTMRFGEDIDMSIRILSNGFTTQLIEDAYVFHKRRTDFRKFFKQVYNSGIARINLYKRYPQSLKIVHLLPAVFTSGCILLLTLSIWLPIFLIPLILFALLIFLDSSLKNQSLKIGILSVPASFIQLCGYGCGFFQAIWQRIILGKPEFEAFTKNFYK
jgi:glycosyltransferase involved in cell wall biosynthesis